VAPQILIASTTWWAMPVRIALAFSQAGASVSGLFPRGNPLEKARALEGRSRYAAAYPLRSLRKAIQAAEFDLIVPCDDRVVEHLHQLYAESVSGPRKNEALCALIARSLGNPSHYSATLNRSAILGLAERNGISIPQTSSIRDLEELQRWIGEHGLPAVLKVDGTWGGSGVRILHTAEEAEAAYLELTRPLSLGSIVSHVSFHNYYPLFTRRNRAAELTVQTYIEGRQANAMFVCWEGEVLGALDVEVLFSHETLGASTIVRTTFSQQMEDAGRVIAKSLALSGFFGLDFIVDSTSGKPYLLELNPRATQLGHLEPAGYRSLVKILYDHLTGAPPVERARPEGQTIAFFPQSLRCDSDNPLLEGTDVHHDVPWDEPALVKELKRRSWNDRKLSALAYQVIRKLSKGTGGSSFRRTGKRFELKSPKLKD
jgi:hypothetical protein